MRLFVTYLMFLSKFAFITYGAMLPHQGRVLISGSAFEGTGLFRFALVDQSGAVVWNHEGGVGDPQNSLSIPVEKGFYQCRLGDTSFDGMAELPDTIFTPENPLKLRIWFDDGTNGLQRLGQDQNLMIAPYAMTSSRSESEKIAMRFADEIIRQAGTSNLSVDELIERISSFAQQATTQGTITKDMLPADIFAEMNKTKLMQEDHLRLLIDVNKSLSSAWGQITRPITREMLPADFLQDINQTRMKNEDSFRLIGDLNKTLTLLGQVVDLPITKDMLPEDLFNEMNKTVQMFYNSESIISDLNRTLNQALVAINRPLTMDMLPDDLVYDINQTKIKYEDSQRLIYDLNGSLTLLKQMVDRPITRDMLPESVRNDLNRTITKSMLGADVLADLNRSKKVSADLLEDGAVSTAKLDPIILKYLKPEIRNQPRANAVVAGNDLNITVNAEGKYLTFQWQKDGIDLPGEKNPTLSLSGYTPSVHNGKYVAVVSNDFGSVQTIPLSLNIQKGWDMNVTQVVSGLLYLNSNGDLFGMFDNNSGRLGTGDTLYSRVGNLISKNVKKIDSTSHTTVFLKKDGTLWGVGKNSKNILGKDLLVDSDVSKPVEIISGVKDFALGGDHLLLIKTDGSLWGIGDGYELGLGDNIPVSVPTMIVSSGVVQVSTNNIHTLFVKSDGSLWGMGESRYGKLGNGRGGYNSHYEKTPFQIESSGVIQASAGWHHSMYVKSDGSLWAIGANWQGRLGDGSETERSRPVQVLDSTGNVRNVSAGVSHTLFIKTDGSLWGMGDNSQGQLGDGTTDNRLSPILIDNSYTLSASIGRKSFYVKSNGTIWAMGQSLFRGAPAKQTTPIQIPQLLSYDGKVGVLPDGFGDVVGYKNNNGTATLVPYPKAVNNSLQSPYKFSHWTGDFGTRNDSNITLPYDSKVVAHFTRDLNDSDNDSLTNYDELMVYDTNPDSNDTDGDGYLDGLEISSNTDPKAFSVPGNYTKELSSIKSGNGMGQMISGNSRNQVAVSGQNGVEIYQIENNGSIRLVTTISPPSNSDPNRFSKNLTLNDEFLIVDDRTVDRGMTHVYSIGSDAPDFSLLASVRSAYNGAWDFGTPNEFAYGRQFVVRSEVVDQRRQGDHPSFPRDNEFWSFDIHQLQPNDTVTKVMTIRHPHPEVVLGSLSNNPKGTLEAYETMGYPLLHNGVVSLPIYARFDSGEWMYVVRMSVDQNSTLSIHEPSAPGRITSMVMDNNQLIVNHIATHSEVGGFVDTFRLSDGNRTTIRNTPGSNEYLGGYTSHMRLGNNGSLLYSISGANYGEGPFQEVLPNKTISISTPLTSSSPIISQYPSSSGKFTLTDKYFVTLDNYSSQNLQNHPQNYHVVRVYPKDANLRPSPTHTVDLNSSVSLEMIWMEPGTFTMGSPESEEGRSASETQHEVTLTEGFYLGKYEVTQAQYEAVMTGNSDGLSPTPSEFGGNPNRPVEQVSWEDAQVFLSRLNAQEVGNTPEGWAYVLPTEAQWEYACRAGTITVFSWGNSATSTQANFRGNYPYGGGASGPNLQHTTNVGQYAANPWGFFDMHGNVSEWTLEKVFLLSDNPHYITKGGGFDDGSHWMRSAGRVASPPDFRNAGLGFRVSFQKQ